MVKILIVGLIALLIVVIFKDKSMVESVQTVTTLCLIAIGVIFCVAIWCDIFNKEEKSVREEIEENANILEFYIDGNNVKYEYIDLDQYDISYDKESKRVYLTSK